MIDIIKRRMLPLLIALLVVGGGIAAVAGISQANSRSDGPSMGMPYFLYEKGAGLMGPCGKHGFVRTAGTVSLPNRHYETKLLTKRFDGSVTEREFYDYRGFSSAYRFLYCKNSKFMYRYYGKTQVHREYVCTNHVNEGGWLRIGCGFTSGWKAGWRSKR